MKRIPTAVIATLIILATFFTAHIVGTYFCPPACKQAPLAPIEDDDTSTDPMIGLKVVQFTASWCAPCKQQDPIIQRMANEGLPVLKCDIDRNKELAAKFQVTRIPTIIFFYEGKVAFRYTGVQSYETLMAKYHGLLAKYPPDPKPGPEPKPKPVKPQDNDDSGLPVDKGRFPYIFQMTRPL